LINLVVSCLFIFKVMLELINRSVEVSVCHPGKRQVLVFPNCDVNCNQDNEAESHFAMNELGLYRCQYSNQDMMNSVARIGGQDKLKLFREKNGPKIATNLILLAVSLRQLKGTQSLLQETHRLTISEDSISKAWKESAESKSVRTRNIQLK
jgi:hypothetical protein